MDDEDDTEDEEATTDFVDDRTSPITVLHMRDHPAIDDQAPVDQVHPSAPDVVAQASEDGEQTASDDDEGDRT